MFGEYLQTKIRGDLKKTHLAELLGVSKTTIKNKIDADSFTLNQKRKILNYIGGTDYSCYTSFHIQNKITKKEVTLYRIASSINISESELRERLKSSTFTREEQLKIITLW